MNTAMYAHKFTAKHLRIVQEELEYMVLGPQGAGKLACGDEGGFGFHCSGLSTSLLAKGRMNESMISTEYISLLSGISVTSSR